MFHQGAELRVQAHYLVVARDAADALAQLRELWGEKATLTVKPASPGLFVPLPHPVH